MSDLVERLRSIARGGHAYDADVDEAADKIEELTQENELNRNCKLAVVLAKEYIAEKDAKIEEQATRICELESALTKANARERPAFEAGYNAVNNNADCDLGQSWQQYRCQDDTDWKVVDDKTAANIDAALGDKP